MNQEFDAQAFRRVMGQFATGVTVITTLDQVGNKYGMTANSFTSVSLDPPLVLVCVGRDLDFCRIIADATHFSVNILASHQEDLSRRFAMRGIDRFEGISHRPGRTGPPLLADTLAHLECSRYELLSGGDHLIVLGRVEHLEYRGGEPLLYFGSSYRWLQS
ncbi:MAG TPA: flavin reductase family protein [Blastocatellia bacterium]|nr:flavin reductase family protein [Blastocatellia bacterium]